MKCPCKLFMWPVCMYVIDSNRHYSQLALFRCLHHPLTPVLYTVTMQQSQLIAPLVTQQSHCHSVSASGVTELGNCWRWLFETSWCQCHAQILTAVQRYSGHCGRKSHLVHIFINTCRPKQDICRGLDNTFWKFPYSMSFLQFATFVQHLWKKQEKEREWTSQFWVGLRIEISHTDLTIKVAISDALSLEAARPASGSRLSSRIKVT